MATVRSRQIVIAGAGIAGLAAALAFARRGYTVRLFEQAPCIEAVGAGIQLSPNATRILDRLGVLDELLPAAVKPRAVVLKDAATLRLLANVPLGEAAERRWKAPYLVAHRADLQSALIACAEREPGIRLTTGAPIADVRSEADGIVASMIVGGNAMEADGALLVGADGVWSTVRGLTETSSGSRFSGEVAWRATISADSPAGSRFSAAGAPDCVSAFLHPGFHLIAYPVRGGAAFNLVAFTPGAFIEQSWSGKADPGILAQAMRGTAPALVRVVEDSGPWTIWPIHTVEAKNPWTAPGIALIGDAAHAMTPFAAQGAAMAVEDAATLAGFVAGAPGNLAEALAGWEQYRKPRVAKVARRGAINRLAWHAGGPVALARNLFLKMRSPESLAADLDWLYGWEPPDI